MSKLNEDKTRKNVEILILDNCFDNLIGIGGVIQKDQRNCKLLVVEGLAEKVKQNYLLIGKNGLVYQNYCTPKRREDLRVDLRPGLSKFLKLKWMIFI